MFIEGESVTVESATGDADVEIARIEGETAVALAEIHAESNETQTEAMLEAQSEADDDGRDVEWLVAELDGLRGSHATLAGDLSATREELTLLRTQMAEMEGLLAGLILASQQTPSRPSEQETGENSPSGEVDTAREENIVQEAPEEVVSDQTPKTPARRPIVRM